MNIKTIRQLLAATFIVLTTTFTPAFATSTTDPTELSTQATDAYNQGNYDLAQQTFILAIQASPQNPDLYRSLARTFFWKNDYAAATAYYDFYLRLAPANATDLEQIHGERRLSATRAGTQVWQTSEQQRLILNALNDQLDEGHAYTPGGGGAWSLYQTLIRSQFAQPELAQLKKRLVRRLFDEIESNFVVPTDQPAPQLDLDDWKIQHERIEATTTLTNDEVILDALRRRSLIVTTAESLLLARYPEAAQQAEIAMRENPDVLFLTWYRIAALLSAQQNTRALAAIDEFEQRIRQTIPTQLDYIQILRAVALQNSNQSNEAANIYFDLLAP